MPYNHKKSLRTLTDEQFSDGTTIDGTRIDDALGESVEHFNNVPGGDVSTRLTKTQYIFGYQPAGYTGTPDSTGAGGAASPDIIATSGSTEGPTWPWNFITNNEFTAAEVGAAPVSFGNPFTPTAGFQNRWRIKGANYDQIPGVDIQALENEGTWEDPDWANEWAVGGMAIGTISKRNVAHNYQMAWSHSWVFEKPVILDSLCVLMRTDSSDGYYDAPFEFDDNSVAVLRHQSQNVLIQVSVDNEFSKEDRSLNDVEVMFSNRRLDGYKATDIDLGALPYDDMIPNSPEYNTVPNTGSGIIGRLMRFRDLNIPIRQRARVRLSICIPWFVSKAAAEDELEQQGLATGDIANKYFNWIVFPSGSEPMWGWALDGNMTVLEQVTS